MKKISDIELQLGYAELRIKELEARLDEMAMSYNHHAAKIRKQIEKASDALDYGRVKDAEIILLRLLKG